MSAPQHDPSSLSGLAALRVLVADDNAPNRRLYQRMLERLGQCVELVEDGTRAVERFAEGSYDLVLLDFVMPGLSGPEAAREMRAIESRAGRARTAIFAATALSGPQERQVCRTAGMDGFLAKPFRLTDLHRVLASLACSSRAG